MPVKATPPVCLRSRQRIICPRLREGARRLAGRGRSLLENIHQQATSVARRLCAALAEARTPKGVLP
jgi:hypothetical protein